MLIFIIYLFFDLQLVQSQNLIVNNDKKLTSLKSKWNLFIENQITDPQIQCIIDICASVKNENNILILKLIDINLDNFINNLVNKTVRIIRLNYNDTFNESILWKFNFYIMFLKTPDDLKLIIHKVLYTRLWNPRGKFIVYLQEYHNSIFDIAWKYFILNIIVIKYNKRNDTWSIYSYFPYKNNKCENTMEEYISSCNKDIYSNELYPKKIPFNLNNCPIRICVTTYEPSVINSTDISENPQKAGFEQILITSVFKKYNISRQIVSEIYGHFGDVTPNHTFLGPFKSLDSGICDFAYGHLPNIKLTMDYFDVSFPMYLTEFSWLVPSAKENKPWSNIIRIFTPNLWYFILLMFIFNAIIWGIFGKLKENGSLIIYTLRSWYTLLYGSIALPKSSVMRIVVIFWTIFSLLLACCFQSKLLYFLIKPTYEHQISNEYEMTESSLIIIPTPDAYYDYLRSDSKKFQMIIQRATFHSTEQYIKVRKNYHDNVAILVNVPRTKYFFKNMYLYPDGRSKIYLFKNRDCTVHMCFHSRKGFPWLHVFERTMSYYLENGLINKWSKDLETDTVYEVKNEHTQINVHHLTGAFFALFFGLMLSTICFIVELFGYSQKINNK